MPETIRRRWETSLTAVDRELIEAHFEQCAAAAGEDSFSGFLRRCIHRSGRPVTALGHVTGIDPQKLAQFLRGMGELQSREIDGLVSALDVELLGSSRAAPSR
jgi:hypothetical protein